jgi:hypothetical protein
MVLTDRQSCSLLKPRIQAEYTVVYAANLLSVNLASAYQSKLQLNMFEISEDCWSVKLQDCGNVDNYAYQIDQTVKD